MYRFKYGKLKKKKKKISENSRGKSGINRQFSMKIVIDCDLIIEFYMWFVQYYKNL